MRTIPKSIAWNIGKAIGYIGAHLTNKLFLMGVVLGYLFGYALAVATGLR